MTVWPATAMSAGTMSATATLPRGPAPTARWSAFSPKPKPTPTNGRNSFFGGRHPPWASWRCLRYSFSPSRSGSLKRSAWAPRLRPHCFVVPTGEGPEWRQSTCRTETAAVGGGAVEEGGAALGMNAGAGLEIFGTASTNAAAGRAEAPMAAA